MSDAGGADPISMIDVDPCAAGAPPVARVPPTMARGLFANSAWLIGDKVVRMGFGLVVWVWLARHFGPAAFGTWNYAIAFVALFAAVANLGLDGIVVRELVSRKHDAAQVMGTVLALRLATALAAGAFCLFTAIAMRPDDPLSLTLVALNAVVVVLQSSQVIDFHFQAAQHTRPLVVAMNGAFLVTTALRLALLLAGAPMLWFGITLVIEAALAAAALVLAYQMAGGSVRAWRIDLALARHLLGQSWPMLLSGLAVMAYMRLDQVMLATMVGDDAVGEFSAALRLAEAWYFIPMAITTAAFPMLMRKRAEGGAAFEQMVQQLYDGMFWLGLTVALMTSLLAPWAVALLYGPQYATSAAILSVQIWAGIIVSMSFVHGRWLLAEGLQSYGLLYTACGAALNVTLNLMLIPRLGALGAAWATLVTQFVPMFVQLFLPKARRNFVLMVRAVGAPLRYRPRMRRSAQSRGSAPGPRNARRGLHP